MSKSKLFPHDRFVKSLMSNKRVAREFFETHIPQNIQKDIDFNTLELQKSSFINDKLKMQEADLLYSVQIQKKPGYFYLLLEHASTPDKMLPYRMIKYMIAIMDAHLEKSKSKTLPFIFPLILYTGAKPYKYSNDLFDLFKEHKELARDTLFTPYPLIDLTQVRDEELKKYAYFGTMALLAKHIHDKDILPIFKDMLYLLKELEKRGELEYIYI